MSSSSTKRCIVATMVVVFLLQATVDAGRLFQFQGDDANNGGAAIISLPSDNKAGCEDGYKAVCVPAFFAHHHRAMVAGKNLNDAICGPNRCFVFPGACVPC
ncbi:hypothetical protein BDA96_08G071800 [Sorghum bicolor]|uniref:Uncharacterized protein n=1 Tax=Sorghum bicolor TaxID=4558 RepID=A0A921QHB8_SORBI|nr:hypothetical protein BDA96_08G071800 [Sorghum bicolor]